MGAYFKILLVLFKKDLRLEFRSKALFIHLLLFSLGLILIGTISFGSTGAIPPEGLIGLYWIALLFPSVILLTRSFAKDYENGAIYRLILSKVPPSAILIEKILFNFIFLLFLGGVIFVLVRFFFQPSILGEVSLAILMISGILGLCIVGTAFAIFFSPGRLSEVLFSLIFFPLTIPLLIGCIKGAVPLFIDQPGLFNAFAFWLKFILIYDGVFFILALLFFAKLLRE